MAPFKFKTPAVLVAEWHAALLVHATANGWQLQESKTHPSFDYFTHEQHGYFELRKAPTEDHNNSYIEGCINNYMIINAFLGGSVLRVASYDILHAWLIEHEDAEPSLCTLGLSSFGEYCVSEYLKYRNPKTSHLDQQGWIKIGGQSATAIIVKQYKKMKENKTLYV